MDARPLPRPTAAAARQAGVTLVELMVGMTIGLLITSVLLTLFVNISKSNQEQFKAAEQIENGRFAIDLLTNDIRHAGFYGDFSALPPAAASLPDPCSIPAEGDITSSTANSSLAFYVQGYSAASLAAAASIPSACASWIDSASLKAGSDIVVVRRVDTIPLIDPPVATSNSPTIPTTSATPVLGDAYAQTTNSTLSIQYGAGPPAITYPTGKTTDVDCKLASEMNAKNVASTLYRKDYAYTQTVAGGSTRCNTAATIRKLHVHIYFVAKCRTGLGTNGKCSGSSAEDTIPTLKRLELTSGGTAPTMTLVPLVEGIEYMKLRYGIDNAPAATPDGVVDSLASAPSSVADWQNVVMADVRLVARNPESSGANADSKTYDLGAYTYTPSGTAATYKRHLFTQQIYIYNVGGRRET